MPIVEERDGVRVRVYVRPRARENAILGAHGDAVKIHITSPPLGGAANRALREYLASALHIPASRVEIIAGETSRHKVVRIQGLSLDRVRAVLLPGNAGD